MFVHWFVAVSILLCVCSNAFKKIISSKSLLGNDDDDKWLKIFRDGAAVALQWQNFVGKRCDCGGRLRWFQFAENVTLIVRRRGWTACDKGKYTSVCEGKNIKI